MSSTDTNQYGYLDQPQAPAPKKRRRWVTPAVGVAALLVGVGIGSSADPEPEVIEAEPEVITETITETVEVEVERTPQVCLDAIDSARQGFTIAADVMTAIMPGIEAAYYHDVAGMQAATADLEALSTDMNSLNFPALAAACEGSA